MVRPQHLLYIFMGVYPRGRSMAVKPQGSWPMLFSYWAYHWWSLKSRGLHTASTLDFSYTSRHLSLNPYPSPIIPKQLVDTSKRHRCELERWLDGQSTVCSSRGPSFNSQDPHDCSQPFVAPVSGCQMPLLSTSTRHSCGTQTYRQAHHPDT